MYSVKGSIKNFDTVEFTVEDIFPMDKGTTGATGYELGDEIIEYRMSNPERLGWKIGMIHSHHNMRSYFSGVDDSELSDNTEFHNYYLSLIVNNQGDMVAKVAFRGDIKVYECKDEDGKTWNLRLQRQKQIMFTFDCEIHTPKIYTKVPEDFAERTAEIIKESDNKLKTYQKAAAQHTKYPKWKDNRNLPAKLRKHKWFQEDREESFDEQMMEMEEYNKSFSNPPHKKNKKDMSEDERYWDFTRFLLRFGDELDGVDTLENALEDTSVIVDNVTPYVRKIITMYPALFEKYWDIFGEINTEVFLITTGEVLDILENYIGLFEVVEPLVNSLELMVTKMQVEV